MNKGTLIVVGLLLLAILFSPIIPNINEECDVYGRECDESKTTVSIYDKYFK
ncbi:MAG: hypothetical protein RI935_496 [Candidatus Parcubacteria bacterium]|jgi:hypothetical protein